MNRNTAIILATVAGLSMGAGVLAHADVLKKTDGKELAGVRIKWFESRQEYQVEGSDGSMIPVPADEVESLDIAKPAGFDQAVRAVTAKQYAAAIPALEDVVSRYHRLVWDAKASELLANAYIAQNDCKKAVQVMRDLMSGTAKNQISDDQYVTYWHALMGAQMMALLKKEIADAIAGESKTLATLAMIKRGDVSKAEGKREDAVLDYLRAALTSDEAQEIHPEALYKAALVLDELRDPRADELRKRVVSKYPASAYARRLSGQM